MSAPPSHSAEFWIRHLQLIPHREGGFYREIVHSTHHVVDKVGNRRLAYTTIYFLLTPESPSHLHRLRSDETWLYHAGDPLQVHVILRDTFDEDRIAVPARAAALTKEELEKQCALSSSSSSLYQVSKCVPVGPHVDHGELLQYTVPGGAIFGSSVSPAAEAGGAAAVGYSLVSCIVSPGFDFKDFELFTQAQLMQLCPQHEAMIRKMAYETIPP